MKSFKHYLKEKHIPNDYYPDSLYHGHNNDSMRSRENHSQQNGHIFATEDLDVAKNYGKHVHRVYIRKGLKTIDLTNRFDTYAKNSIEEIGKKFGKKAQKSINSGSLWSNKPLERKVINHLQSQGHEHIILHDQANEEGDEGVSHIIQNPSKNIFVGDRR